MTVYECSKCEITVSVHVPVQLIICSCGRQMRRQEQGQLQLITGIKKTG